MPDKPYTTKVVLEIGVSHWGTPQQVSEMLRSMLHCPAVTNVEVVEMESNYRLHQEPAETLTKVAE